MNSPSSSTIKNQPTSSSSSSAAAATGHFPSSNNNDDVNNNTTTNSKNKKKLLVLSMSSAESDNTIPTITTRSSSDSSSSSSSSRSSTCSITQMNQDFLISILQLLPVESIVSFSMTCRRFRSLGTSDHLWKSICRREWGPAPVTALLGSSCSSSSSTSMVSWKRVYQQISQVGSVYCSRLSCKCATFPHPRASHSLNHVSDYLVLFGGGCEGGRHLDDTWMTYVGNGVQRAISWHPVKSGIPTGRFGHTCTLVGSTLILFGGINDKGVRHNDTWFGQVHDGSSSLGISISWELASVNATAPPARGAHACCSLGDDKMLIHGGIGPNGIRLDDMWMLDLSNGLNSARWWPITPPQSYHLPPARSGHTLVWIGGKNVVLFGGRGFRYEVLNDLWIFSMDEGYPHWLKVIYKCADVPGQVPLPRVGHSATSILGGRVLIYGGEDSQRRRKNDFWLLDVSHVLPTDANDVVVNSRRALCKMWKWLKAEGQQPECRSFHTACTDLSGGRVYIFGGMVDGILHPAEVDGLRFDGGLHLLELVIR